MSLFVEIRKISKQFETEMKAQYKTLNDTKNSNLQRLHPDIVKGENAKLDANFNDTTKTLRSEYLTMLNNLLSVAKEDNKPLVTNQVDYDLLQKLNIISQAGIKLEESEVMELANLSMTSQSSLCVRKVCDMAKASGYTLQVPDETTAINAVTSAIRRTEEFIRHYDGCENAFEQTTDVKKRDARIMSTYDFLKDLESNYNRFSTSEFHIVNGLSPVEESMLKAALSDTKEADIPDKLRELCSSDKTFESIVNRSHYKELLKPDNYKITIDSNEDTSKSKEYLEEYHKHVKAIPPLDDMIIKGN